MDSDSLSLKDRLAYSRNRSCQEKSVPKFLRKVFYILEENKHSENVSWSNDGAAIVIKKPTEFAEKVLPCYFKHNNLASFVRQLNMYNFKKKKNYHYDHAYGHEMFQKGKMYILLSDTKSEPFVFSSSDLLRNIQRKTGENNQILLPKVEMSRAQKEEIEVDVDYLLQENLQYKRVQKTLSTQLQFIERKVKDIKTEMNSMYRQSQKQSVKEDFLKKVIRILGDCYGSYNIRNAIEAAVESTSPQHHRRPEDLGNDGPSQDYEQETNQNTVTIKAKPSTHNDMSNTNKRQQQRRLNENQKEESTTKFNFNNYARELNERCEKVEWNGEDEEVYISEDESVDSNKHLNKSNNSKYSQELADTDYSEKRQSLVEEYLELQNHSNLSSKNKLNSKKQESNEQGRDESCSKSDTYLSWYVDFEKKLHNPDRFLDGGNKDYRGMDLETTFHSEINMLPNSTF